MRSGPLVVGVLLVGGIAAMIGGNGSSPSTRTVSPAISTAMAASVPGEWRVSFRMCSSNRHTCVVDGDTIWLEGQNLRLESYDTPEPYNDICGGQAEVALAHRASARLLDLLNSNPFTVETHGVDRYDRTLATIKIGGRDVGDILIAEGLARSWPNGREFWC
jgi:micrococcal nuclease